MSEGVGESALNRPAEESDQSAVSLSEPEASVRARAERLRHLQATQLAILSAESLATIAHISIGQIKRSITHIATTIVLYDFKAGEFEVMLSDHARYSPGLRLPILQWEAIEQLRQGKAYWYRDVQDPPERYPGFRTAIEIGGRSVVLVPIRYRDELIGSVTVTTGEVYEFSSEELAIVQDIAASLAIAVQNRRLLEDEQRAREREATLRAVALSVTRGLDLDEVLREVLSQLNRLVPSESSAVFLGNERRMTLSSQRGVPIDVETINRLVSDPPPYMTQVLTEREAVYLFDTQNDSRWVLIPGSEYIRSWLGIPLVANDQVIGLMTVDRSTTSAFSEDDVQLAITLAGQVAIAIQNAHLYEQAQAHAGRLEASITERTRELEALYHVTRAAVEAADLDTLLYLVLDEVKRAFDIPAAAVFLHQGDDAALDLAAYSDSLELLLDPALAYPDDALPDGVTLQDGVWIPADRELAHYARDPLIRAYASISLRSPDRPLGVLSLFSNRPNHFGGDQARLLNTLADHVALAIDNVELRRRMRQAAISEERERLAREMHDAVTQTLYSQSLLIEAAQDALRRADVARVEKNLQSVMRLSHRAIGEMRQLLLELRESTLAEKGLAEALDERLELVERRAGINAVLAGGDMDHLPPAVEDSLYRVALEALNNALRHSKADAVRVALSREDGVIRLEISDDGVGFDLAGVKAKGGIGLDNMRQRVQQLEGTLVIESSANAGTRVTATVPL